jgi:glycosyltransferase involved in cell wall biosynthesis
MSHEADRSLHSVVIPVYNSEELLPKTVERTVAFFEGHDLDYEIILVDDGSRDGSWQKVLESSRDNSHVVGVRLLKNSGQHSAICCGIRHARGDLVITMDDDLQNPPEEILHLIEKIEEGYDVVFARFAVKRHPLLRRLGSRVVNHLNTRIFAKPREITLTNFRIFTREVADRLARYRTVYPYIPGMLLMMSSRVANVETQHHSRPVGSSNYGLVAISKLVAALLFNYSSFPLKLLTTVGFGISALSFGVGAFYLLKSLLVGSRVTGWPTLTVLLSFLNGFIIVMLGVIGEYVSRVINHLSVESSYQVRDIVGR